MPKVKLFNIDKAKNAAKETFWKKGFNATSMNDLLEAMDISRQSLYDTFGNKNELFTTCIESYQKEAFANTCSSLVYNKPIREVFESFYNGLVQSIVSDDQNKSCFILNSLMETLPADVLVDGLIKDNYQQLAAKIKEILAIAQNVEKLQFKFDLDTMAHHIIMTIHGIKVMGKINKNETYLKSLVATSMVLFD
jgi:TetR/AcrR family transcriptional regulator, transcriptional repressor for nem operon